MRTPPNNVINAINAMTIDIEYRRYREKSNMDCLSSGGLDWRIAFILFLSKI